MEVEVQPGAEAEGGETAEQTFGGTWVVSPFFRFFPFLSFSFFSLAVWGEGDWGALLGSIVSICGRVWPCKENPPLSSRGRDIKYKMTHTQ